MIARVLVLPIKWYKKYISPHLGTNCRFLPTCSEYAMEALLTHGAVKGNPLCKGGYDPVPPKGRWKNDDRRLFRGH